VHLSSIAIEGYRASAFTPVTCQLPGRFSLLLGANGAGKTTINEAIVHAHPQRFPRLPAVDAAVLGPPPRAVRVEYAYEPDPTAEGALGVALQASGFGGSSARVPSAAGGSPAHGDDGARPGHAEVPSHGVPGPRARSGPVSGLS
jgi:energy-coupling factor transporter ATP-binding protein EcfA2